MGTMAAIRRANDRFQLRLFCEGGAFDSCSPRALSSPVTWPRSSETVIFPPQPGRAPRETEAARMTNQTKRRTPKHRPRTGSGAAPPACSTLHVLHEKGKRLALH